MVSRRIRCVEEQLQFHKLNRAAHDRAVGRVDEVLAREDGMLKKIKKKAYVRVGEGFIFIALLGGAGGT